MAVVVALGAVFLIPPDSERGAATAADTDDSGASAPAELDATTRAGVTPANPATSKTQAATGETAERAEAGPVDRADKSGNAGESDPGTGKDAERTEDGAPAQPAAPKRDLLPLTRYNHPEGPHFSGTSNVDVPPGFSAEGVFGSLAAAPEQGARKLYACTLANRDGDWFSSIDQSGGCEGQRAIGLLGYIFAAAPEGVSSLPLYRCNAGDSHFDSLNSNCEGETRELLLGYLITS